ncbi:hypothetical protein CMALT430_60005 [Carnobacterium maltaromaticum]|nr:hypothetical protein CMALT430_60005 [Carnobacterium maltaromaticum]
MICFLHSYNKFMSAEKLIKNMSLLSKTIRTDLVEISDY